MPLQEAVFAGHSPTLLEPDLHPASVGALRKLAAELSPIDLALVVSPHWQQAQAFLVHSGLKPPCIQDFYGFPPSYYALRYEPPGAPDLAARLAAAGEAAGVPVRETTDWGLDHGHWTPLIHLLPDAAIPVVPLSISDLPPAAHRRWGAVIRRFLDARPERVLFIATGSLTHRLDMVTWGENHPFPAGERFDREVLDALRAGDFDRLMTIDADLVREAAPEGGWGPLMLLAGVIGPGSAGEVIAYERLWTGASLAVVRFAAGSAGAVA